MSLCVTDSYNLGKNIGKEVTKLINYQTTQKLTGIIYLVVVLLVHSTQL